MVGRGVKTETAVTPVVGVILLLAIVIVLAALVASFAGGAADVKAPPPSADLAVYPAGSGGDFTLVFEHRGGDQVRTRDLRINTWIHLPDGGLHPASHEGEELEGLFGTGIWRAGAGVDTGNREATAGYLGLEEEKLREHIGRSAVVEVAIYHLPSGALLHKSSLLLKER